MLLNILTGYNGITMREKREIAILACRFREVLDSGMPAVFTDRHAYLKAARFFNRPEDLQEISWAAL